MDEKSEDPANGVRIKALLAKDVPVEFGIVIAEEELDRKRSERDNAIAEKHPVEVVHGGE